MAQKKKDVRSATAKAGSKLGANARGKVAFLGGGNMADALIRGLLSKGYCRAGDITVSDVSVSRLSQLTEGLGVTTTTENAVAAAAASTVVVAVKPNQVAGVLTECANELAGSLVLSIAAGVPLATMAAAAPKGRFVRVMPNTPALVGEGISALFAGANVTAAERRRALEIFTAVGRSVEVASEGLLDAVTGLSGSGPAFVFLFLEALSDGGVQAGLPRSLANELAAQTVAGAAKLALESGTHVGALKDMVTSPNGTTIAGVAALEAGAFRGTVMRAVDAAAKRAKELANG